jgi:hypothetical protein
LIDGNGRSFGTSSSRRANMSSLPSMVVGRWRSISFAIASMSEVSTSTVGLPAAKVDIA